MNGKSLALAAATLITLMLAAACAHDKSKDAAATAATPTPALPADVAKLAQPETPGTPAPAAATKPEETNAKGALSSLEPTGEFVSPASSQVAPKTPGRVATVYVDAGQRVSKGQPLLVLETEYLKLDVQRTQADLARTKAAEDDARREWTRKKGLLANESIPQATFDKAQAALDQAQAARQSTEAALALARQKVEDAVIRSPITGVVDQRKTNPGERLGEAGVAFVIVQTAPLKLRFSVPERYLPNLKTGQPIIARVDPYPGETFSGRIKTLGGVIDPSTRTFFAEAEFPNSDGRLRPGLFARVELGGEESHAKAR
ncbi:MAG TPA: efflux RND transporter periplasmic adaptor subunit [Thermoanaerobaculia bacterium]|nr:efflux RND transporter periplasmic adaptor subunit [Thermoanaerobaculia bacterium]